MATQFWELPDDFIDLTTPYTGAQITRFNRLTETQVTGLLRAIGDGICQGLEVTIGTGLEVNVGAGLAIATHATYGPCILRKTDSSARTVPASAVRYLFAQIDRSTDNDSRVTAQAYYALSDTDTLESAVVLARITTNGSTVTEIVDLRLPPAGLGGASEGTFTNQGIWNSGTTYSQNQVAKQNGKLYYSLVDDNTDHDPAEDAEGEFWGVFGGDVTDGSVTNAKLAAGIDAAKIGDGTVSNTEFGYLNGATSAIQTQLDGKATSEALSTEAADRAAADTTLTDNLAAHTGAAAPHPGHLAADGSVVWTANQDANTQKLVNLAPGENPGDAVTVEQLEDRDSGFNPVRQVRGATVSPSASVFTPVALPANSRSGNTLTATANGSINVAGIDGITNWEVGQDVAVMGEAIGANNGIFTFDNVGSPGAPWSMTRRGDFDSDDEVLNGSLFTVREGQFAAGVGFYLDTPGPITVNTTALSFSQAVGSKGEINTAQNANLEGVGVYEGKTGTRFDFLGIANVDGFLSIAKNIGQKSIRIAVNVGSIMLPDLGGKLPISKGGTNGTTPAEARTGLELDHVTNDAQVKRTEMGVANGVATLDSGGLVPPAQLPANVGNGLPITGGTMSGDIDMQFHFLNNIPNPTSSRHAANKTYVDSIKSGRWTAPVRLASTTTLSFTAAGDRITRTTNGLLNLDGFNVAPGDRVLLPKQGTAPLYLSIYNGIFDVIDPGSSSTPAILERSIDAKTATQLAAGLSVYVLEGNSQKNKAFMQNKTGNITPNTTTISFVETNVSVPGPGYGGTSTSSVAIGMGSKTFATQTGLAYLAGSRVRITKADDVTKFMEGTVTAYSGANLTVNVDFIEGIGTFNNWTLSLAGRPGADGGTPLTKTTDAEAEEGVEDTHYMTAAKTAIAIAALAPSGGGGSGNSTFSIAVGSTISPLNLSSGQAANSGLIFTGTRSSALDVIPPAAGTFVIKNSTLGGYNIQFRNSVSSSKIPIGPAETWQVFSDGIDVWGRKLDLASLSPLDLSGLFLWLKADAVGVLNGYPVETWPDSSGNGHDATNEDGVPPTFITDVLNGKPAVRFNGSQYLTIPHASDLNVTGDFTMFIVYKVNNSCAIIAKRNSDPEANWELLTGSTGSNDRLRLAAFSGGSGSQWNSSLGSPGYQMFSLTLNDSANELRFYRSGVADPDNPITMSETLVPTTSPVYVGCQFTSTGSNSPMNGDILEFIAYNRLLSSSERQSIESYLTQKYDF